MIGKVGRKDFHFEVWFSCLKIDEDLIQERAFDGCRFGNQGAESILICQLQTFFVFEHVDVEISQNDRCKVSEGKLLHGLDEKTLCPTESKLTFDKVEMICMTWNS